MPLLKVEGLNRSEWGGSIVRLHYSHRSGMGRYGVARIINKDNLSRSFDAVLLGHDDESAIYMDFDARQALGIEKGAQLNFRLRKLGCLGKLCWYLKAPDPRIYIPAWLAACSVGLGLIGVILGIIALLNVAAPPA